MGRVLGSSRVTSKYQVTVPKKVRSYLKLIVGDELVYVEDDGKVYVAGRVDPAAVADVRAMTKEQKIE